MGQRSPPLPAPANAQQKSAWQLLDLGKGLHWKQRDIMTHLQAGPSCWVALPLHAAALPLAQSKLDCSWSHDLTMILLLLLPLLPCDGFSCAHGQALVSSPGHLFQLVTGLCKSNISFPWCNSRKISGISPRTVSSFCVNSLHQHPLQ